MVQMLFLCMFSFMWITICSQNTIIYLVLLLTTNPPSHPLMYLAICRPLSTLVYKRRRVITVLVTIWILSLMISVPEIVILSAVSFLNDRKLFPCVTEEIFWDLTVCVPTWSNKTVFIYTTIKVGINLDIQKKPVITPCCEFFKHDDLRIKISKKMKIHEMLVDQHSHAGKLS